MWGLLCNSLLNSPVATVDARAGYTQNEVTTFKGMLFVK